MNYNIRREAESIAVSEIRAMSPSGLNENDADLVRGYRECMLSWYNRFGVDQS